MVFWDEIWGTRYHPFDASLLICILYDLICVLSVHFIHCRHWNCIHQVCDGACIEWIQILMLQCRFCCSWENKNNLIPEVDAFIQISVQFVYLVYANKEPKNETSNKMNMWNTIQNTILSIEFPVRVMELVNNMYVMLRKP